MTIRTVRAVGRVLNTGNVVSSYTSRLVVTVWDGSNLISKKENAASIPNLSPGWSSETVTMSISVTVYSGQEVNAYVVLDLTSPVAKSGISITDVVVHYE